MPEDDDDWYLAEVASRPSTAATDAATERAVEYDAQPSRQAFHSSDDEAYPTPRTYNADQAPETRKKRIRLDHEGDGGMSHPKRRRVNTNAARSAVGSPASTSSNEPGSRGTRDVVEVILESWMKLSARDKATNDTLFGYEIIDTKDEGTEPPGTTEWKYEQLEFKELQHDAIRMLIDPEKRHDKKHGLEGWNYTPVRYWAKRLEALRLIRLGESPWHLEFNSPTCSFLQPVKDSRPPIIPQWYCDQHRHVIATLIREKVVNWVEDTTQWAEETPNREFAAETLQSMRALGSLEDILYYVAPDYFVNPKAMAAQRDREAREALRAMPEAPREQGAPAPENKRRRKKRSPKRKQQLGRRSTRRHPIGEIVELDSHGEARPVGRG